MYLSLLESYSHELHLFFALFWMTVVNIFFFQETTFLLWKETSNSGGSYNERGTMESRRIDGHEQDIVIRLRAYPVKSLHKSA